MALIDVRVVAAEPDPADRKAAISLALRDSRLLKQRQGAAARANESPCSAIVEPTS